MTAEAERAGDICLHCGLCCNGGLFGEVAMNEADREGLNALDGSGGEAVITLPCRYWKGRCTIYQERPSRCRSYSCKLLDEVESGATAFDEALKVIDEAKRERGKFIRAIPDYWAGQRFVAEWEGTPPRKRTKAQAAVMLDFLAYCAITRTRFIARDDRAAVSLPSGSGRPTPSPSA